jgi:hypothetical protein
MGWLFINGCSRRQMIHDRTENWEKNTEELHVKTACLAHCYRGGIFSGILWAVWERTITREGRTIQETERWITCDLLRYQKDYGWGYKDMDESMHPYFYSCPLSYLELVPMDQYGGNAEWRKLVQEYHAIQRQKRRQRQLV